MDDAPRVLGLDLSLTSTGFAVPRAPNGTIEGGRLRPPANLRGCPRLDWIVRNVIEAAVGDPAVQLVALEGYSFGSRTSHAHSLGELGGVVRLELWRRGMPFVAISPATIKQYATGKGNASKEQVLAEAIRRLGYQGSSNDVADALWVHAVTMEALGHPVVEMPKQHVAAVHATGSGKKKRQPLTEQVAAALGTVPA